MKAFLMHEDRDLDLDDELQPDAEALTQDLELETLFAAMARDDAFVFDVARTVVLARSADVRTIAYRQQVLRDAVEHAAVVREVYALTVQAVDGERKRFMHLSKWSSPDTVLSRSVQVLGFFVSVLRRLRTIAGEQIDAFESPGFRRFFAMLVEELDDDYFAVVDRHLSTLRFGGGVPISARLGRGNKGTEYVLRTPRPRGWLERLAPGSRSSSFSFQIAPRDESGARALADLRARGIDIVADVLARSNDHILGFFNALRSELAFYVGCLNLQERLSEIGQRTCLPEAMPAGRPVLSASALYDACLALTRGEPVVANDVAADARSLVMITGANQGGKSTFLRSVGLAQLMTQAGMFVAADSFRADVRDGIFTHHKREEDAGMERGKLDEELARMSRIVERIAPRSMLLCNESFASTNEREGSEIGGQVVRALIDRGVKVLFVTHLFDLASGFATEGRTDTLFLRAERRSDGGRTFRLTESPPMPTSFGQDLYRRIFEGGATGRRAGPAGRHPRRGGVTCR